MTTTTLINVVVVVITRRRRRRRSHRHIATNVVAIDGRVGVAVTVVTHVAESLGLERLSPVVARNLQRAVAHAAPDHGKIVDGQQLFQHVGRVDSSIDLAIATFRPIDGIGSVGLESDDVNPSVVRARCPPTSPSL
eukprot:2201780-Pyramimonas_sp.AAC.2